MPFPSPTDYIAVVQHPQQSFTVDNLRQSVIETKPNGMPNCASGAYAVVVKAAIGGTSWGLRCYTRYSESTRERYERLATHLAREGPVCAAKTVWYDNAVRVRGDTWPVLQVEWIEGGRRLDEYVEFLVNAGDTQSLSNLAEAWLIVVSQMADASFAHGDLQHGNVLIDARGAIRLIDFDAVWIPEFEGLRPPNEIGHSNYQHPSRRLTAHWDQYVDAFSALVIYLSLRAVAAAPALWADYHDDNLIFTARDFGSPGNTPVWAALDDIRDDGVKRLTEQMVTCCAPEWRDLRTLDQLIGPLGPQSWSLPQASAELHPGLDTTSLPWPIAPRVAAPLPPPPPVSEVAPPARPLGPPGPRAPWPSGPGPNQVPWRPGTTPPAAGSSQGPARALIRVLVGIVAVVAQFSMLVLVALLGLLAALAILAANVARLIWALATVIGSSIRTYLDRRRGAKT